MVLRTLGVGGALPGLGAQRPVAPPARRGSPFLPRNGEKEGRGPLSSVVAPLEPLQGGPCNVGSPPTPAGEPGFLWKKAGGKNTREEEVLPPWTHLFWFGGTLRGSSFFFCLACGPVSYARNGPPTGWAGWEG